MHLGFELAGAPAGVTDKGTDRRRVFVHQFMRFIDADIVIQFQPLAFLPFERGKHELILSHRSAEKNGNVAESLRRRLVHQIGHLLVERAIQNHAERPVFGVVRGDEKNGAPKIRIEHVRMGDEQRTGQAQRHSVPQIAHAKLDCACSGGASAFGLWHSHPGCGASGHLAR